MIFKGIFGRYSQILQSVFFFNIVLIFISKFEKTLSSIFWICNLHMNSKLFFSYISISGSVYIFGQWQKQKTNLMLPIFDHGYNFVAKNLYIIWDIRLLKSILSLKLFAFKSIFYLNEFEFLLKAILFKSNTRVWIPNGIFKEKLIIFWEH